MPNTLMVLRYGTPAVATDPRPLTYRFEYPTWSLTAEPRVRMPYRMQVSPAVQGNYIGPITNAPIVIDMDFELQQRRGLDGSKIGNPVAVITALQRLRGRPLTLQWGAEIDWGDEWHLTGVDLGFTVPAKYPRDVGGSDPRDGGMVFDTIGVRLSFTADNPLITAPVLQRADLDVSLGIV